MSMKNYKQKVLMIDDEPIYLKLYQTILKNEGFDVYDALGYEDARSLLATNHFDLIILDIEMPKYNGIEILEKLKSNPATKNIPVIMSTGTYSLDMIEDSFRHGAATYLEKPVNSRELMGAVKFCTYQGLRPEKAYH